MPSLRQSNHRDQRHRQIREVLRAGGVHNQTQLQERLAALGLNVEQATISRDLKALAVVKGPDGYRLSEAPLAPASARVELVQLVRLFLTAIDCAGQIVVLRTGPGRAQPLGLSLDNSTLAGVLGTIAGDDTIFVAMRTVVDADRLTEAIRAAADGGDVDVFDSSSPSVAPSLQTPGSGRNGQPHPEPPPSEAGTR